MKEELAHNLIYQVSIGNSHAVRNLLEQGADPNEHDGAPLRCAAQQGDVYNTILLLNWNADPTFCDEDTPTALMIAAENGYIEVMSLLLDAGADVNATIRNEFTSVNAAEQYFQQDAVHLLLSWGAFNTSVLNEEYLEFNVNSNYWSRVQQLKFVATDLISKQKLHEAEPIYWQMVREATKSKWHNSDIPKYLNNLADFYEHCQRYSLAEQVYVRILKFYKASNNSSPIARNLPLHKYIQFLTNQPKYAQPERLHKHLLQIYQKELGVEHPLSLKTVEILADLYRKQTRYDEAEQMYVYLLSVQTKIYGSSHKICIEVQDKLKTVYQRSSDQFELESTYLDLLERRKQALGLSHSDTTQTINNLASLYGHQGRDIEAINLYQQLVTIQEEALGGKDAKTCAARNNLERLLRKTNVATYQPNNIAPARTTKQMAKGYAIPVPPKPEPQVFALNMERVQQKIEETVQVHQLLAVHFTEETTPIAAIPIPAVPVHDKASANPFKSLATPYFVFLNMLLQKPVWKPEEIDEFALPLGLLAHGAMEHLNDMAFEACNEPLFEGNDPIEINISLAKELLA